MAKHQKPEELPEPTRAALIAARIKKAEIMKQIDKLRCTCGKPLRAAPTEVFPASMKCKDCRAKARKERIID